jgi:FkbM family methyltransferase
MRVRYQCPSNFHIPRALIGTGLAGYEPATMAAFLACAESTKGAVFDVGANIGIYSLAAVSALQKSCVAFEPFPAAADVLEDIARRYKMPISLRRAALAACTGSMTLYLSARSDMSNSLNPDFRRHSGRILVETTTLDEEASRCMPGIVKIDTETTEMDVLRGGRHVFSEIRPTVVVEVLGADLAVEARDFFHSFGYFILELGAPEIWKRITGDEGDIVSGDRRNWLVSPHKLSDAFFDRAAFWATTIRALPLNDG